MIQSVSVLVRVTLSVSVALLATPAFAAQVPAKSTVPRPEETPPPTSISRGVDTTVAAAAASANGTYRVDSGGDLDQYLCRDASPLDFTIEIGDNFGPVEPDGRPAPGNALYGKRLPLTMYVYDVDEASGEVDYLYVNGHQQSAKLTGADSQWSKNTYSIPSSHLRFPTATNPSGRNNFTIDIDTTSAGWCVQVDWAEISTLELAGQGAELPVMLVHGITGSGASMEGFRKGLVGIRPSIDGRTMTPTMTEHGSIAQNARIVAQEVEKLVANEPSKQVDIVAHSMGGLAARKYAWDNPGRVRRLLMIATPNGGSVEADMLCYNRKNWKAQAATGATLGGPIGWPLGVTNALVARKGANEYFKKHGPCDSDSDGLYQLTTDYVQNTFNKEVKDLNSAIVYATIAGMGGSGVGRAGNTIPGEDDSAVTVQSVRWLGKERGGLHESWEPKLDLSHSDLIKEKIGGKTNTSIRMAACFLWGTDCKTGDEWLTGTATQDSPSAPFAASDTGSEAFQSVGTLRSDLKPNSSATANITIPDGQTGAVWIARDSNEITATIPGAPFEATDLFGGSGQIAYFTGPTTMTVTNAGSTEQGFDAFLLVQSQRSLDVVMPEVTEPGVPVQASAKLLPMVSGDSPKWEVQDSTGDTVSTGDYTPAQGQDPGHWQASITVPDEGSYSVISSVGGGEPRWNMQTLLVADDAALTGMDSSVGLDVNGNGLFDVLRVTVTADVRDAGDYTGSATLVDGAGRTVATGWGRTPLPSGSGRTMDLYFDGKAIHDAGLVGPWRLKDVALTRDGTMPRMVDTLPDGGEVAAIVLEVFEHDTVVLTSPVTDEGVDTSSPADGTLDELLVSTTIDVEQSGNYAVNARLLDRLGGEVTRWQGTPYFTVGSNRLEIPFNGSDIGASATNGPYTFTDLTVYPLSSALPGLARGPPHGALPRLAIRWLQPQAPLGAAEYQRIAGTRPGDGELVRTASRW